MFKGESPHRMVQVIRRNQLQQTGGSIPISRDEQKIVVVSVIGSGGPNHSGYKRAFSLVLDAFGKATVFSEKNNDVAEEILQVVENVEFFGGGGDGDTDKDGLGNNVQASAGGAKGKLDGNGDDLMDTCFIDGFYYAKESILFMHLNGADDPLQLLDAAEELYQSIQNTGFLPVWSSMKSIYCRYLLLIFSLSHVVFFSDRASSFNTNYLHLFRILDAVRLLIKPAMSRVLEKVKTHKDWVHHARICSPRMLFLFEIESSNNINEPTPKNFHCGELDEKQGDLENEIYHIFRKCRIITNISANSLFAIPAEDDYVFLFDKSSQNVAYRDLAPQDMYNEIVAQVCNSAKNKDSTESLLPAHRSSSGTSIKQAFRGKSRSVAYHNILASFKEFILHHTRLAMTAGFDDDSRRVAEHKHFFVVPTFGEWKIGFQVLCDIILNPDMKIRTVSEGFDKLMRYINVNSEYLHSQCSNVFPKIYAVYQRGLPEFYSERTHRLRLTHAMNAYLTISRGHGIVPWLNKLAEKCDQYWRRGRQQCEILSLFKHSCVNPLHRVPQDDSLEIYPVPELDSNLPEMKHIAGARIVSHCNCGRKQGYRDEPFTIREANLGFYQRMGKDCCDRLECIEFPVFTPTTKAEVSLEDMLQILKLKSNLETCDSKDQVCEEKHSYASQMMEIDLRQEENEMGEEGDDASDASQSQDGNEIIEEVQNNNFKRDDLVHSTAKQDSGIDKALHNSKSEYLPGMMHSKSPTGLLPKFSSWSLIRVGTSSLYNHSSGISPRSGFLSGTNFLLPWDVIVKAEAGVSKPVPRIIRGRRHSSRPKPIPDEFNVKIFFGLEYECHRGHRFMANDVEKIVNFNIGNSALRESASKIAASDVPLYFKCPCKESRDGKTMIAQLLRIHVVTPKAPVHCMIFPKVQPGPSPCPAFFPGLSDPVKLAPSSYWVLRLPYCYVGDHQIYGPPTDTKELTRTNAKLLKELFTVKSMTKAETKVWEKDNL